MRILRNPADVAAIKHPGIHRLIRERLAEMKLDEPFDQFGELVVVESGDNPGSIEWLEHQPEHQCYEMLFVMSDDGFGTVLFVPDDDDIDPDLLAFCRQYATE
jgi:hypothetical protein